MTDKKTKEFIKKAKLVHGDLYDYSETKIIDPNTKITIRCRIHNNFTQLPAYHLRGNGCTPCGIKKRGDAGRNTTESFIEKATATHGDKYDYTQSVYTKIGDPIKVICKKHGPFTQATASHHLAGSGCPQCGRARITNTTENFIERAKILHGNTYDYSKTVYTNNKNKVIIICPTHGSFFQPAVSHLRGSGCCQCGFKKTRLSKIKTTEKFIEDAKKVHGDIYDYSSVVYNGWNGSIDIICRDEKHGKFVQTADSHLAGHGCQKCAIQRCKKQYSKSQIEWMDLLIERFGINIENAANVGEHKIIKSKYRADGYCEDLNIVFEFHGCFWHGCPVCFPNRQEMNLVSQKTHEELYNYICKKEEHCLNEGYKYIKIWECEWKNIKNDDVTKDNYLDNLKNIII